MTEHTITATAEEIKALQIMLHRACLHSGMEVAEAAAFWNRKLLAVLQPQVPAATSNGSDRARAMDK